MQFTILRVLKLTTHQRCGVGKKVTAHSSVRSSHFQGALKEMGMLNSGLGSTLPCSRQGKE